MKYKLLRNALDCIMIICFAYAAAMLIAVASLSIAKQTSDARLLGFGQGIGLLFALGPPALVSLFVLVATPVLGVIFFLFQLRWKHWIWIVAFAAGGLLVFRLSKLPIIFLEIAYYFLLLRGRLLEQVPPKAVRKWHITFAALPLFLLLWAYFPQTPADNSLARALVVKPSDDAHASFSLSTHSIPIPEGFAKTRDWWDQKILDIHDLSFSPDGTRAAFIVAIGGSYFVVIDGQAFPMDENWYAMQLDFRFSDDSETLLFIVYDNRYLMMNSPATRQIGSFLAVKERHKDTLLRTKPLEAGETMYTYNSQRYSVDDFQRDSTRLGVLQSPVKSKRAEVQEVGSCGSGPQSCLYHVSISENDRTVFQSKNYTDRIIRNLAFSTDGTKLAYVVGRVSGGLENESYQSFIAIDDLPGPVVDAIANKSLRFSPDGKYVAYGAQEGDKVWWIVEEVVRNPSNVTVSSLTQIDANSASSLLGQENISSAVTLSSKSSSIHSESILSGSLLAPHLFSSQYFTLSLAIPPGFEIHDQQNSIRIAKSPFVDREIGDDNAFFRIVRYDENHSAQSEMANYRKLLKNREESQILIDDTVFPVINGEDWGRFEGQSAGKVFVVFFQKSWLEVIERPANSDQSFNPIATSRQILSTMRFSK